MLTACDQFGKFYNFHIYIFGKKKKKVDRTGSPVGEEGEEPSRRDSRGVSNRSVSKTRPMWENKMNS